MKSNQIGDAAERLFQKALVAHAGGDHAQAEASLRLFAKEVLPVVHKMEAPLHDTALPEREPASA